MLSKSAPTTAGSAARSARASQRSLAREIAHRAILKQLLCKKHNIGDVLAEAVIKLFESRGAYASLTKLHVVQQVLDSTGRESVAVSRSQKTPADGVELPLFGPSSQARRLRYIGFGFWV